MHLQYLQYLLDIWNRFYMYQNSQNIWIQKKNHYNYQKLPLRKTDTNLSILDKRKNEINGENQRLNNEYEQFYKILTSAVDLYKDDSNHRLQIIAIQISIIAIFISVFLEDDVRNLIVSFFDQLYTSLK